jgi:hypothetical protein
MQQRPLNPQVKAEIQKILLEALSCGWTTDLLWETRFWNITEAGNCPGLAAVMQPGDKLEEVTEGYIEIIRPSGVVHRFYRPGYPHPWIKKGDNDEQKQSSNNTF